MKMKPNLNDEKMDEKTKDSVLEVPNFKPNIFADKVDASNLSTVLDGVVLAAEASAALVPVVSKEGKYICLCKKTYAHR
jgi:hypothetical protein